MRSGVRGGVPMLPGPRDGPQGAPACDLRPRALSAAIGWLCRLPPWRAPSGAAQSLADLLVEQGA
eukprot:15451493-Alexandrium_andersonii.AAC.1